MDDDSDTGHFAQAKLDSRNGLIESSAGVQRRFESGSRCGRGLILESFFETNGVNLIITDSTGTIQIYLLRITSPFQNLLNN